VVRRAREYGSPKTLYNGWKRWSDMGVFARMKEGLASEGLGYDKRRYKRRTGSRSCSAG
jgi:hypothetical protein